MWPRLRSWSRALLARGRFEDEVAEEIRFHVEQLTADLVRSGVAPVEAARRARLLVGSVDNARIDCRQAHGLRWVDDLLQDARLALRRLRRSPGFTTTALATLALCLGANVTLFAVVDSILLRPLPFPHAERLASVYNSYPRAGVPNDGCSLPNYYERRGHLAAFASIAIYREGNAIVGEPGATTREPLLRVSPELFATLGRGPTLGRAFTEAETAAGADAVVILGDGYWRQALGADPRVVGRSLRVNGRWRRVVGVLPPDWSLLSSPARLFVPLSSTAEERAPDRRHSGTARMLARLRPGVTLEQAQQEVDAHNAAVERDDPQAPAMAQAGFRSLVVPLHADHVAAVRRPLLLLQAGALLLLLIGTVNLVNLLLIRVSARARELAVQQAIGARRRHLASGVLVETVLLALTGALLGLGGGIGGVRLLGLLGTDRLPLGAHVALGGRAWAAALLAALLLGLAMGLPAARQTLRRPSTGALRSESRGGTAGLAAQRLRHAFVVAQMALAFVLLTGAGLLAVSLRRAAMVSPGFVAERVVSGQVTLPGASYPDGAALLRFSESLLQELQRQPGVRAVAFATNLPMSGVSNKSAAAVEGYAPPPGEPPHGIYSYAVTGDYFAALGVPLREGRLLTAADSRREHRVCVVDDAFARRYWPRGGALGHRLFEGSEPGRPEDAYTVVGVVGAVKQAEVTEDGTQGAVYYPFGHRPDRDAWIVARTAGATAASPAILQRVVRAIDSSLPVSDMRMMDSRVADTLVERRSPAILALLFAAMALLLTAIGTYGVLSYAVAQRRREIGLRMALGAKPGQVRAQLAGVGAGLFLRALVLGAVGAWLTGRAMQGVLYQVPATHAGTLALATVTMAAVSALASLLPVRRAARTSLVELLGGG